MLYHDALDVLRLLEPLDDLVLVSDDAQVVATQEKSDSPRRRWVKAFRFIASSKKFSAMSEPGTCGDGKQNGWYEQGGSEKRGDHGGLPGQESRTDESRV